MPSIAATPTAGPGYLATQRLSAPGVALVVAAHVAALAMLATLQVLPVAPDVPAMMVDLLAPAATQASIEPARPTPSQPRVERQRRIVPQQRPILASHADNATTAAETTMTKEASPAASAGAQGAASEPAAAVSQPRFNADYLSNPAPAYPPLARRMGEEGKVVLRVFVEPQGRPSQIELKLSSNSPRLDQAAQDAVWRWKFIPAKRGDEAIGAWVLVPITFTLKN
jgi:protein TonB